MRTTSVISTVALFLLLFFLSSSVVAASLVTVKNDGEIVWAVLSSQDEVALEIPRRDFLEVKDISAGTKPSSDVKISLTRTTDGVLLKVESDLEEKELDVTGYSDGLVEIEERAQSRQVRIGLDQDKFSIEQEGVVALTEFPLMIDSESAELSVVTISGTKYLSVLPLQAVESTLRSQVINRFSRGQRIPLVEGEHGELTYVIQGHRSINIFNLFNHKVPVSTYVSASTGEILSVDQPTWLKILGFLFA